METAPITHPVMEVEEAGERLKGQTPGLVPVRYLEQVWHKSSCAGWGASSSSSNPVFNHLIPQLTVPCSGASSAPDHANVTAFAFTWGSRPAPRQQHRATRKPTRKLHV